jgi:hypothetical protein
METNILEKHAVSIFRVDDEPGLTGAIYMGVVGGEV